MADSVSIGISFQPVNFLALRNVEQVTQAGWTFTKGGVLFSIAPKSQNQPCDRSSHIISDKHRCHLDMACAQGNYSISGQKSAWHLFEGLFNILVNVYLRICSNISAAFSIFH